MILPVGKDGRRAHLSLGLSAPTGSIDEKSLMANTCLAMACN